MVLLSVCAASAAQTPLRPEAQSKRSITLDDLEGVAVGKTVIGTTVDVSPDGRLVAVERAHNLSVVNPSTGGVIDELREGIGPSWGPGSDRLAFYSTRSGKLQLWMWDTKSRTTQQLTNLTNGIDADPTTRIAGDATDALQVSWSPDGTRIAFASRVAVPMPQQADREVPLVLTKSTPQKLTLVGIFSEPSTDDGIVEIKDGRTWGFRTSKRDEILFNQIFVVNVRTRDIRQMTSDARTYFHPAWSPDAKVLIFGALGISQTSAGSSRQVKKDSLDQATHEGELVALDVATRMQRIVASGSGIKYRPRWSRDGLRLAYLLAPTTFSNPEIRIVEYRTGNSQVAIELDRRIGDYEWTGSYREFFVSYHDGSPKLAKLHSGKYAASAIDPRTTLTAAVWSRSMDDTLVWVDEYAGSVLWLKSKSARRPTKLIELDPGVNDFDFGRVEVVTWKNSRGEELAGKLLYPPTYNAARSYAVIVDVYPLGGGNSWMHPMGGNQTWAAAGYLVFKPMPRAPHVWMNCSRSADYCSASKGPNAWDVMVDDVMTGIDYLVRQNIVDPDRMCLYGHSNGATTVNYLVTQTNRFKCAVSVAGSLSDWISPSLLNSKRPTGYR